MGMRQNYSDKFSTTRLLLYEQAHKLHTSNYSSMYKLEPRPTEWHVRIVPV